jgi:hypothetical protein
MSSAYHDLMSKQWMWTSSIARSADEVEVNLGSLDAPDQLMPPYESWIVRRESWFAAVSAHETIRVRS